MTTENKPLLSLCMIIRDAEDTIQALLDSVTAQPVFDEIVLVDTGSTDRTREIISEHFDFEWPIKDPEVNEVDADGWFSYGQGAAPAKVTFAHFKWVDDFAAARQFSFELTTGRWRMFLDSDDILPLEDAKQLRNAILELEKNAPRANALAMSYIYRDSQVVQPATIRCARWDDGFYWSRPIHEALRCKSQRVIGKSASHNFKIIHNKPDEGHEKSLTRNHAIAMKAYENAKTPGERAEYAYFCSTYLKSVPEGINQAIAFLNETWNFFKGTNFGCYARFDLARIYLENNLLDEALTCAAEIEGFSPEFKEGLLLLGILHNRKGDFKRSALFFDQVQQREEHPFVNFDEFWFTEGLANAVAANTYLELGRVTDAERALLRVPPKLRRFGPVLNDHVKAQRRLAQTVGLERLNSFVDFLVWSNEVPKAIKLLLSDVLPAPIEMRPEIQARVRSLRGTVKHHYGSWQDYKDAYASIPEETYHTAAHDVRSIFVSSRVETLLNWVSALPLEGPPVKYASIGFQDGLMETAALEKNPRLHITVADVAPQASDGLKRLQEKFPGRVEYHQIEKSAYDWCPRGQEGTFDLVTLFEVIEHVPGDDGALVALKTLRRMLVPESGTLLLSTPVSDLWVESVLTEREKDGSWAQHVRALNSGSLHALLNALSLHGTLIEGWDGTFVAEVNYSPTIRTSPANRGQTQRNVAILVPSTPKPFDALSHLRGFTGGSEEAVIYLAEHLSRLGHEVTVYTPEFTPPDSNFIRAHMGVLWRDVKDFDFFGDKHETVLFWRCPDVVRQVKDAPYRKVLWLHDYEYNAPPEAYKAADEVVVLSEAHGRAIAECDGFDAPFAYGANGIDEDMFPSVLGQERDPNKVIYMSSPDRGLHRLLEEWPKIRERAPEATLDIYYDWTQFAKIQPEFHELLSNAVKNLEGQGVRHIGGVDQPTLHEAMRKASVWVYSNTGKIETFCISAVKAQACGLTCITTDAGALGEVVLDGQIIPEAEIDTEEGRAKMVDLTVSALNNPEPDTVREERRKKALEKFSWRNVAKLFERML